MLAQELKNGAAVSSPACESANIQLMSVLSEIKTSIPVSRNFQTWHASDDKKKIDDLRRKLADSMGRFGVAVQMHIVKKLSSLETNPDYSPKSIVAPSEPVTKVRYRVPFLGEDAILESLAPVDEARFDHETSADSCLQGTRETMLKTISEWIDSLASGPLIFWLAGLAGTGKTTIATTVCEELDAREAQTSISAGHRPPVAKLGADFFMSRHSAPRRNPHSIVCTIAYQLADRFPSIQPFLISALRLNPRIVTSKNMEKKITELIIGPLENVISTLPSCIVIVLDALDECDGHGAEFLPLFARLTSELGGVRVKLVITSRFETDIRSMFSTIGHASFRLHDIEQYIVQGDIQRYLQHSFREITLKSPHVFPPSVEWPSPKDISTLVSHSGALFIYAATVVKFVDVAGHSPERRLETVIKTTGKATTAVGLPMLDSLYMEVLRIAVTDAHSHGVDEDLAQRMQQVAGAVVLLQVPVSIQTLSRILGVDPTDVRFALDGMASMLLIPLSDSSDPIRIFHPSFPDFLLDPKRCSDPRFGVQAGMIHNQLIRRCLVIMNESLHYDMCAFGDPSLKNADVQDLPKRIERYLFPELVYACIFWKVHLELMTDDNCVPTETIRFFISTMLLPWIECLSILASISVVLPALSVAHVWCMQRNMDDEIKCLESIRELVLSASEVADSALRIYQIALFHPAFNVQSNAYLPPHLKVRLITAPSQEWSNEPGILGDTERA
ncbi:hypothetical protein DFH08DRAFT_459826 [Mycena albidolilacea]|uniref:Nephrocystin 3-like N-terminal domain-containing protein n=1 Tax=Mycena albidolilacea TaxID=1033008 RepID=A0AAD7AEB1_9AGAR|nr:hypothetical protein DFH08DRAFT_459826 [Mycena albidolilacea]